MPYEVERCGACRCMIAPGKIEFCRKCGTGLCPICVAFPGAGAFQPLCWGCYMRALAGDSDEWEGKEGQ